MKVLLCIKLHTYLGLYGPPLSPYRMLIGFCDAFVMAIRVARLYTCSVR
jgi:hypothetical protein